MAASSAETAAADAAATAPATAAPDGSAEVGPATAGNAEKQQKLSIEGKATTPSEAGGGAWTVSGGWEGNENSTKRVTSAEGAIAQVCAAAVVGGAGGGVGPGGVGCGVWVWCAGGVRGFGLKMAPKGESYRCTVVWM